METVAIPGQGYAAGRIAPLLTFSQAADLLGVSPRSVRRLAEVGEIPVIRVGGSVRLDPVDIDAYIGRQRETL